MSIIFSCLKYFDVKWRQLLFLMFFVFLAGSINAQIEWILKPVKDVGVEYAMCHFGIQDMYFFVYRSDGSLSVYDYNGKLLRKQTGDRSEFIDGLTKELVVFGSNSSVYLMDSKLKVICGPFELLKGVVDYEYLYTKVNGKFGLIDYSGKTIIKNKYQLLQQNSPDQFLGIDDEGNKHIIKVNYRPSQYSRSTIKLAKNRVIINNVKSGIKKRYALVSSTLDTIVSDNIYESMDMIEYKDSLGFKYLIVKSLATAKYGLMDEEGKLVIDTIYKYMDNIFNVTDYLNVGLDDVHKLVCLPTKKVLNFNNVVNSRGYNDSVIICTKDGIKSVFSRPDGRVVASLNSDKYYCSDSFYFTFEVDKFRLFNMRKNSFSNYTFNNVKGLTQNDFSAVWSDNRNTAIVARGQCYGLFDFKKNTYIADTIYLDVYSYSGHYYIGEYRTDEIVQTSEIDSKGVKYIKRIKKSKTEYDIINKSGKILLQGLRRKTEFVNRDLLLYYHESPDSIFILNAISGKSTFFTKRTNWYSSPNLIGDHFVYFDDKFYSINDLMNMNVSPILVDNITELKSTGCYIYRYEKGNRFGFYQGDTKATEPIYDVVYNYVEEYIGVKQDGKIGLFKFKCSQPLLFPKQ